MNKLVTTIIILAILAISLASCAQPDSRATAQAQLDELSGAEIAASLIGGASIEAIGGELWAVDKAVFSQPGAFALLNDVQRIAVFVSPAGQTASGATYYMAAWIDTSTLRLLDGTTELIELGIHPSQLATREDIVSQLRSRGFVELTSATAPTLIASLRMAMVFLKGLGSTISDVIIAPAYPLTNPWWCGDDCIQIDG
jgi:hypothetical protein